MASSRPLSALAVFLFPFLFGTGGASSPARVAAGSVPDTVPDDAAPTVRVEEYGQWEELGRATLSPDGRWVTVPIRKNNDEDELRIRRLESDSLITVPYGGSPSFSADGRWLAYTIGVSEERREKLREADRPVRTKLGLLDLRTGDTAVVPEVSSFEFSDAGRFLAMRRYPPRERAEGHRGADLLLRDLTDDVDTNFGNVASFEWQDDGTLLAMVVDAAEPTGNGVRVYAPRTGRLRTLASRSAEFTGLAWRPSDDDLAALRRRGDDAWADSAHVILAWRGLEEANPRPLTFDPGTVESFPDTLRVVEHRDLRWSDDGDRLFFGTQVREPSGASPDTAPADSAADSASGVEELPPADVLVWHSSDVEIIPLQEVRAERDRRDNYLAAWHVGREGWTRLGTGLTEDVQVLEGGDRAVGFDRTPYRRERMFGPVYRDIYLIDVESGERTRVAERVQYWFGGSPGGRYLLWLEDDHYRAHDVRTGETANLTSELPVPVVDVDDDHTVEQKPPFGVAGWTQGDGSVLIYDEYDTWRIRPDGSGATRLTAGRADSIRHRYVDLEDEEPGEADFIDPSAPAYWDLYDEWTEEHGYGRAQDLGAEPDRLVWRQKTVSGLVKADSADVFLHRISDFEDSPDYFRSGPRLADAVQVTETNPFQSEYAWGRSELVSFENARGERLQGALFYPANYDPEKSYPMITYIYEIVSPAVRGYQVPSRQHPYNRTTFTQEGYFVFMPDITYRARQPGRSAVDAIVPAVRRVLDVVPAVDSSRLGLVGHSWGGYQTAFTVTRTDLFRSAVAGAPLTNMVSMYNSIYWRTGGTDARIFEIAQGRMEVPPWEDMDAYVANSPLHHVESMETPLLMAQGTDDGAVEFNQGVEFFNAARRAGKELVFLVYDGENHGLSREEKNAADYRDRVLTWFDHYLEGEPAPAWISRGVPYLEQIEEREEEAGGGR
ncbi:MAG: prolyl oligopeptidase family serine peptidase [Candidatus Palauibacterales bacterium]|nr:prolyl oligopeptidase family serine peptidase [Candidatus Palauibacterales bacterium]